MNVREIVAAALAAIPDELKIRTTCDIRRVVPGTTSRATGLRTGDLTLVMQDVECFIVPVKANRTLPPKLVRERARQIIIAGELCTTFVPDTDDTATVDGVARAVLEADVVDLGNRAEPVVVSLLVKW